MKAKSLIIIAILCLLMVPSCKRDVKEQNPTEMQSLPDSSMYANLHLSENVEVGMHGDYVQLNVYDILSSRVLKLASLFKGIMRRAVLEEYNDNMEDDDLNRLLLRCASEGKGLRIVLIASDEPSTTMVLSFTPKELEKMTLKVE